MRFVNADILQGSILNPGTLNRFAYVNGNPVSYVDPFGRSATAANVGHTALDGAGFIPVAGAVFDVVNGVWYAGEGDWTNAGLSLLGAIPGIGDAASGGKIGVKAVGAGADALSAAGKGAKAEKATGVTKTVDDILAKSIPGKTTKGKTMQYETTGGYEQALNDFYALGPTNVYKSGETTVGALPDGRSVNVRESSTRDLPTLEIQEANGRKTKLRYS